MQLIEQFNADRQTAFAARDEMAALCTVANVDQHGEPQLRTLVLREVVDQLAVFINETSPKWPHLQQHLSLLTYWPTVKIQYRLRTSVAQIDPAIVHESWLERPLAPQQMDWFYTQHLAQSSKLASRDQLLAELGQQHLPEPLTAPTTARGLILTPLRIERLDLNQENGVHDRRIAEWVDDKWTEQVLVP